MVQETGGSPVLYQVMWSQTLQLSPGRHILDFWSDYPGRSATRTYGTSPLLQIYKRTQAAPGNWKTRQTHSSKRVMKMMGLGKRLSIGGNEVERQGQGQLPPPSAREVT